jgi:hypothetical protein
LFAEDYHTADNDDEDDDNAAWCSSHGPLKLRTVHFGDITIIYESKLSEQNILPWLKGTIESRPNTKFQINCSFK